MSTISDEQRKLNQNSMPNDLILAAEEELVMKEVSKLLADTKKLE